MHNPTYQDLIELLAERQRELDELRRERTAFAERLLRTLVVGNDYCEIGLVEENGNGDPSLRWWAGGDADIAELVRAFEESEQAEAEHRAEVHAEWAYER